MANCFQKHVERQFIIECIKLYKELPVLWNVRSKVYYDRQKKNKAYILLLTKYHEMYPDATKSDLKKKFNTLRTNYRKELKRLQTKTTLDADDSYEPTLWYYEEMDFLRELENVSEAQNNSEDTESHHKRKKEAMSSTDSFDTFTSSKSTRRRQNKMDSFCKSKWLSGKMDEYQLWASACAADLKKMETTQQIYAKKAIAEIIMEGRLGNLHRHSVQIKNDTYSNNLLTTNGHNINSSSDTVKDGDMLESQSFIE